MQQKIHRVIIQVIQMNVQDDDTIHPKKTNTIYDEWIYPRGTDSGSKYDTDDERLTNNSSKTTILSIPPSAAGEARQASNTTTPIVTVTSKEVVAGWIAPMDRLWDAGEASGRPEGGRDRRWGAGAAETWVRGDAGRLFRV